MRLGFAHPFAALQSCSFSSSFSFSNPIWNSIFSGRHGGRNLRRQFDYSRSGPDGGTWALQSCSRSGRALDGLGPAASNLFAGLRRRLAFNVRVHRSPFGVWRASRYIGSSATALMLDRARQTPNVERFKIGLSLLGAFCLIQPVDFWQGGRTVTGSAARTGRYSLMTCVLYLWPETKKNTR